jgi:peptidoglycan hydrolase CwlO-like protein
MRRATVFLSIFSFVLIVVSASLYSRTLRDAQTLDATQRAADSTRTSYQQAVQEIAAIQDSLNAIAGSDQAVSMTSLDAERRLSPTGGSEALARIAEVRTRIQSLEQRLQQSGIRIAGLDQMVLQLKHGLAEKEQLVARLGGQVDSLQGQVGDLSAGVAEAHTMIAAQSDTLAQFRRELGTIYYVIGSRQDLLKTGVVAARGGVLGMGKTLRPTGHVDPERLHVVDTDEQAVIPLGVAKARVLTAQPPQSYSLELKDGQLQLRILDAKEFRKVRQLVIVTA